MEPAVSTTRLCVLYRGSQLRPEPQLLFPDNYALGVPLIDAGEPGSLNADQPGRQFLSFGVLAPLH